MTSVIGQPQLFQANDNTTGLPAAGAFLYTYASGTNTPLSTFYDAALTSPCPNPITLDNYGQAVFYLSSALYRFNLINSSGIQQAHYPQDNVGQGTASLSSIPLNGFYYDSTNLIYEINISYSPTTQTFTVSPTSASFRLWLNGTLANYTTQTVTHANTSGSWYFYFTSAGVLTASMTYYNILNTVPVGAVYYNASTSQYWLFETRKHYQSPAEWVNSQNLAIGTFVKSITDFTVANYGLGVPAQIATQFTIASGTAIDADVEVVSQAISSGGPYYTSYLTGTGPLGNFVSSTLPFIYNGGTNYLQYNQNNSGTWQMTDLTSGQYVNYYLFASLGADSTTPKQVFLIPGQSTFSTLASAQAESVTALTLVFPLLCFVPVYQITMLTNSTYSNPGKCVISAVTRISLTHAQFTQPFNTSYVTSTSLLSTSSATQGAGEVGYKGTLSYSSGTVGYALNNPSFPGLSIIANGSATSVTISNHFTYITTSASSMATTLPAASASIDGQVFIVEFGSSVTTATWISSGATFVGAPSTIVLNTPYRFIYINSSTQWFLY